MGQGGVALHCGRGGMAGEPATRTFGTGCCCLGLATGADTTPTSDLFRLGRGRGTGLGLGGMTPTTGAEAFRPEDGEDDAAGVDGTHLTGHSSWASLFSGDVVGLNEDPSLQNW